MAELPLSTIDIVKSVDNDVLWKSLTDSSLFGRLLGNMREEKVTALSNILSVLKRMPKLVVRDFISFAYGAYYRPLDYDGLKNVKVDVNKFYDETSIGLRSKLYQALGLMDSTAKFYAKKSRGEESDIDVAAKKIHEINTIVEDIDESNPDFDLLFNSLSIYINKIFVKLLEKEGVTARDLDATKSYDQKLKYIVEDYLRSVEEILFGNIDEKILFIVDDYFAPDSHLIKISAFLNLKRLARCFACVFAIMYKINLRPKESRSMKAHTMILDFLKVIELQSKFPENEYEKKIFKGLRRKSNIYDLMKLKRREFLEKNRQIDQEILQEESEPTIAELVQEQIEAEQEEQEELEQEIAENVESQAQTEPEDESEQVLELETSAEQSRGATRDQFGYLKDVLGQESREQRAANVRKSAFSSLFG